MIFSHYVGCLFVLAVVSFNLQMLFNLMQYHLLILALYPGNWSPIERIVVYIFKWFPCSCFSFRSYIKTESILNWFLYTMKNRNLVSLFYMWIFSFPSTVCWTGCLFTIFLISLTKIRWLWLCGFGSYSVPLVFMSVFVPVPCCFYYYGSGVWFEVWYCEYLQ
jgi:hypothetical protein